MIYPVGDKSGIYCIEDAGPARVYFIGAPDYCLIDTGTPGKSDRVLAALAQIGVQPLQVKRIVLTHHHLDHAGGVWELKKRTGAQLFAHPSDADYITGRRARRAPRGTPGKTIVGAFSWTASRTLPAVGVDRAVNDGDRIGSLTVVHTPGHTPGHICLQRGEFFFSGDLLQASSVEFQETPHELTADVPTSRQSIRKVAKLEFQAILSSHNPPYVFGAAEHVRELADRLGMLPE